MTPLIPLANPEVTDSDIQAVSAVMRSGTLSRGAAVEALELRFCDLTGCAHAIAMSSGTAVLHALLDACEIGPGDEVIVPSFTVPATANPIIHRGATAVFCDISPSTLGLDPESVEALISPRTRAMIPVYPFGMPIEIGALHALCDQHELVLIEDSCEALGTFIEGRHAGRHGLAGSFGFYPNKQITTGEGGICITDDARLAEQLKLIRNHGRSMNGDWMDQQLAGHNFRLGELQAALGVSQLSRWPQTLERRAQIAQRYDALLNDERRVISYHPRNNQQDTVSLFCYHLCLNSDLPVAELQRCRDRVLASMAARGIQCGRYFAPLHQQPFWKRLAGGASSDLPITDRVAAGSLVLPYFNRLTEAQQVMVVEQLQRSLDVAELS